MDLADRALEIAVEAHKGQKDRYGKTYIFHPIRIMMKMESLTDKIVAILHDVVEDSNWTVEQLEKEGFPQEITKAVDTISKKDGEAYSDYIERVRENAIATRVKLADLEDNMDLRRIELMNEETINRLKIYRNAYQILSKEIQKPTYY